MTILMEKLPTRKKLENVQTDNRCGRNTNEIGRSTLNNVDRRAGLVLAVDSGNENNNTPANVPKTLTILRLAYWTIDINPLSGYGKP